MTSSSKLAPAGLRRNAVAGALSLAATLLACGAGQAQGTGSATLPQSLAGAEPSHALVVLANACWFGGLWGDALGETGGIRESGEQSRCSDVAQAVYGQGDNRVWLEKLRAADEGAVDTLAQKVSDLATGGADAAHKDALVSLTKASAAAQRELIAARRAADAVHEDEERPEVVSLTKEQERVAPTLRAHDAFSALYTLDAGDLSKEANAIALLCLADRFSFAHGIPRHMKILALEDPLSQVFGVPQPDLPNPPWKPLVGTELLDYLTKAAVAAGRTVQGGGTNADRYALAYAGVVAGVGDKLSADVGQISGATDLKKVVTAVAQRLADEYTREQAAHPPGGAPAAAGDAGAPGP